MHFLLCLPGESITGTHPTHPPGHSLPLESALFPLPPASLGAILDLAEPSPALPCTALWHCPWQKRSHAFLPTSFQPGFPERGHRGRWEGGSCYCFPFSLPRALATAPLWLLPHLGSPLQGYWDVPWATGIWQIALLDFSSCWNYVLEAPFENCLH